MRGTLPAPQHLEGCLEGLSLGRHQHSAGIHGPSGSLPGTASTPGARLLSLVTFTSREVATQT